MKIVVTLLLFCVCVCKKSISLMKFKRKKKNSYRSTTKKKINLIFMKGEKYKPNGFFFVFQEERGERDMSVLWIPLAWRPIHTFRFWWLSICSPFERGNAPIRRKRVNNGERTSRKRLGINNTRKTLLFVFGREHSRISCCFCHLTNRSFSVHIRKTCRWIETGASSFLI